MLQWSLVMININNSNCDIVWGQQLKALNPAQSIFQTMIGSASAIVASAEYQ